MIPHPVPLPPGVRQRHHNEWSALAARFGQTPIETLREAERLVMSIMRDRGYPYLDPPARPQALAKDHGSLAETYRDARAVMERLDDGSRVGLEEMRAALVNYRTIVEGLLEGDGDGTGRGPN
ncbi:MAG: hypothetical protein JO359_12910 [Candidatus Eremiobacteraeota bacterium]|nr:hypothetical protein [Candidatus Eremiobacteraeota bacterium]